MTDAFAFASGMAQSHASGTVHSQAYYLPKASKPTFEILYPSRPRRRLHFEEKLHVGGGVHRVSYELVEDWTLRVIIVNPFGHKAVFLDLEKLLLEVDGLDKTPWKKHDDPDAAVAKFVMSRMQFAKGNVVFVPPGADDFQVQPPPSFEPDDVFTRTPAL